MMTNRERFIKTLQREKIGGYVPHFELVFFLTMEVLGKVHPKHRDYYQWNQMSFNERKLHVEDMADLYIDIAKKYNHSAIFLYPNPYDVEDSQWLLETIREKTGDEYYLIMTGDSTFSIPDGDSMMDFSVKMYEDPEGLIEEAKRRLERRLEFANKIHQKGKLLDGFALCSDYCFNTNPFFNRDQFEELIVPNLKDLIKGYRELGFQTIKHTDGNVMPILDLIVDCKPDAVHSLDPQGGVDLDEVIELYGDKVCLIGNVNCGLLQTGNEEECKNDVLRSLRSGMKMGKGFIFSTSNCVYTGLPLERYEFMHSLWRKYGNYDNQKW